jgi:hypothetical protein
MTYNNPSNKLTKSYNKLQQTTAFYNNLQEQKTKATTHTKIKWVRSFFCCSFTLGYFGCLGLMTTVNKQATTKTTKETTHNNI